MRWLLLTALTFLSLVSRAEERTPRDAAGWVDESPHEKVARARRVADEILNSPLPPAPEPSTQH